MRVLVLEDQAPDFEKISDALRLAWPAAVCCCVDTEEAYAAALGEQFDAILASNALPGFEATQALDALIERGLDVPFVVVSGAVDEESAAVCIKRGAADYLLKDHLTRLGPAIAHALTEKVLREQKVRAESELRRSKEHYQRLLETVRAIPWEMDPAGWRFTYIGPQVGRLLGYRFGNGAGCPDWTEKIHPEDRPAVVQALRDALVPGQDQDFVHRVLAADGSVVWMRSIVASLSLDAAPGLLNGFTVDITAARLAEQALARRAEELARSNKDLEDFAYVASHDLQEPLRMVSSYTELLAERYAGRLDAGADEFIAFIVDGVTRMRALIGDLLVYSRVGTNGRESVPVESQAALERALKNLRASVLESGASISQGSLPTVKADASQLAQLFQNLIGNSIKFRGRAQPSVRVSAEESGAEWTFSVADNGIGIDPQYFATIFGLFQRLHTAQEYGGTGIGLTICKKIVERHGGRIWVDSQEGSGATFRFTIPKGNGAAS
jgi:PAS domain S-box-containing protein